MPHISSPSANYTGTADEVNWSAEEGTIGVVGVAPWATLDFCRKVYELTPAQKDWHYPRLLIDANSKIPSRGRYLELNERDPSPFIQSTINELASAGATIAVVPCNTAHILFERWSDATIPVISIIDATMAELGSSKKNVAVLGSIYILNSKIYLQALDDVGHRPVLLTSEEQALISHCIGELKCTSTLSSAMTDALQMLANRLIKDGVDAIILACTELSMLTDSALWNSLTVVDSNTALARAALKAIMK